MNLLLTLVTFGIYSAWAKVRREKFFHQNTRLAGAGFDYHGKPTVILRGRVVAVMLLALAQLDFIPPLVRAVATVLLVAILPWLMQRSLRFRLANTSYRGVRFAFTGSVGGAYRVFGGYLLLAVIWLALLATALSMLVTASRLGALLSLLLAGSLLVMVPMFQASWRRYVFDHTRFGAEPFAVTLKRREFVWIYALATGAWGVVALAIAASVALTVGPPMLARTGVGAAAGDGLFSQGVLFAAGMLVYAALSAIGPTIGARVQNLCWNRTRIGQHRMVSRLSTTAFVRLTLLNLALTVVTLGLYRPFAAVASARMRIGALALQPAGTIDDIVAALDAHRDMAVGSEAVDLLGFDLSL